MNRRLLMLMLLIVGGAVVVTPTHVFRRSRRTFVLLLLTGVLTNVAVAWGVLFRHAPLKESTLSNARATTLWDRLALPWSVRGEAFGSVQFCGFGWRVVNVGRWIEHDDEVALAGAAVTISGFPCDALQAVYAYGRGQYVRTGWHRPDLWPLPDIEVLPTSILWFGFIVNSVIYALALWMVISLPRFLLHLIRCRRIWRGLCPRCSYDLRGCPIDSVVCAECGTAIHPASIRGASVHLWESWGRWCINFGRCPKCAYELRGTAQDATACPECGAPAGDRKPSPDTLAP